MASIGQILVADSKVVGSTRKTGVLAVSTSLVSKSIDASLKSPLLSAVAPTEGTTNQKTNHGDIVQTAKAIAEAAQADTVQITADATHGQAIQEAKVLTAVAQAATVEVTTDLNHGQAVQEAKAVLSAAQADTIKGIGKVVSDVLSTTGNLDDVSALLAQMQQAAGGSNEQIAQLQQQVATLNSQVQGFTQQLTANLASRGRVLQIVNNRQSGLLTAALVGADAASKAIREAMLSVLKMNVADSGELGVDKGEAASQETRDGLTVPDRASSVDATLQALDQQRTDQLAALGTTFSTAVTSTNISTTASSTDDPIATMLGAIEKQIQNAKDGVLAMKAVADSLMKDTETAARVGGHSQADIAMMVLNAHQMKLDSVIKFLVGKQ